MHMDRTSLPIRERRHWEEDDNFQGNSERVARMICVACISLRRLNNDTTEASIRNDWHDPKR